MPNFNKTQITSGTIVGMLAFIAVAAAIYFIVKATSVEELEDSEKLAAFTKIGLENNCTIGELRKHIEDMKYATCQTLFGKDNATESWEDWLRDNDFVEKQIPYILGAIFTLLGGVVFFPVIACALICSVCRDRNRDRNIEEGTEMTVVSTTPTTPVVEPFPVDLLLDLSELPNGGDNILQPTTTTTTTTTTSAAETTEVAEIPPSKTVTTGIASRLLSDIIAPANDKREEKTALLQDDQVGHELEGAGLK